MSSLQVALQFITGVAIEGTSGPAFAAVSVTDSDGVPVLDLQRSNFQFAVIATSGGYPEPMAHAMNTARDDGFYMFSIFKGRGSPSELWFRGELLVGVQVKDAPAGRGQAVGVLEVRARPVREHAPAGEPTLAILDPGTVDKGWEGVLNIQGSNFDVGSFALVDGRVPPTTFKSDSLLEADVKRNITDTPGSKVVKVHTGAGDVSNDKTWTVTETDA